VRNSDRFYLCGGLLGTIVFLEAGMLAGPERPLEQQVTSRRARRFVKAVHSAYNVRSCVCQ
jgi:hypothetical protein